jgi:hypothetical protein
MKDERSLKALEACYQYVNGEIDDLGEAAADAADAAAAAAKRKTLKQCADICRRELTSKMFGQ